MIIFLFVVSLCSSMVHFMYVYFVQHFKCADCTGAFLFSITVRKIGDEGCDLIDFFRLNVVAICQRREMMI
jgi:hypothetical protein